MKRTSNFINMKFILSGTANSQLTKWQSSSDWFQKTDWLTLSNRILGKHAHQVLLAFVELANFELECVAVGFARSCEGASLSIGLLHNVAGDG